MSASATRSIALGVVILLAGTATAQQSYPGRPIRFITPYAPGGSTTLLVRLIGEKLTESWGQPVIVDNRPGGNGIIGSEALVRSAPDGHTLILISSAHVINPLMLANLPYDSFKDFAPVAIIVNTSYILVTNSLLPVNNLQEFIAYAKSRPGQINYASVGSGGAQHLMGELFNLVAGVSLQHIPYKGGAQGITDLMGGQVQASFSNSINVIPHIKSGKLRGLAVTGDQRLTSLPQLPTYAQAGLPGYDPKNWQGILAPAGTPKEIVAKLSAEIARITAVPGIRERLVNSGMDPFHKGPEQMAAQMKSDHGEYARVIKAANIKIDQ